MWENKPMNKKIEDIISEESLQFITELLDPNNLVSYQPQGLDPKVVRLFEEFVDEAYEDVSEIRDLASEIIKKIAEQNYPRYNKSGSFDYLYGININSVDSSKFKKLAEFIDKTNIQIYILPKQRGGNKGAYGMYLGDYDPSEGREIEINVDLPYIKEKIDEKLRNGPVTGKDVLYGIHSELFSPLIHELQHAYDDFRSKNKIYQSKEYKQYLDTYMKGKVRDEIGDDIEKVKRYLNLPHEIWARFSQAIQKTSFYTFDIDEEKEKLIYFMNPIKDVIRDFQRSFYGFSVLSEKMKRKLINKVVQFWHYEQEKLPEKNKLGV
jgi:predicted HD phosphohydrolase